MVARLRTPSAYQGQGGSVYELTEGVRQPRARSAASAALVHPSLLVDPPSDLPAHRWPPGAVAPQAWPLGHAAPDDDGPPHRPAPQRHRRVLPGRPEPGHAGDERLGRPGAGLVAQPAGAA